MRENYYRLLGLNPEATDTEIESAYRGLISMLEREGTFLFSKEEREVYRRRIEEAYSILKNKHSRFFYDSYLISVKEKFVKEDEKISVTENIVEEEVEKIDGQFLKKMREQKGLGVAEVARRACITQRVIVAIEREDTEALPPFTYLKGILKEYARAIGLSPSIVVDGYIRNLKSAKKD